MLYKHSIQNILIFMECFLNFIVHWFIVSSQHLILGSEFAIDFFTDTKANCGILRKEM